MCRVPVMTNPSPEPVGREPKAFLVWTGLCSHGEHARQVETMLARESLRKIPACKDALMQKGGNVECEAWPHWKQWCRGRPYTCLEIVDAGEDCGGGNRRMPGVPRGSDSSDIKPRRP